MITTGPADPRQRMLERRTDRITMALMVIWIGVMASVSEPGGMTELGCGGILLGTAAYKRARGWRAGILHWTIGFIFLGVGIGNISSDADIPWFGIVLVLFGIWLLAGTFKRSF